MADASRHSSIPFLLRIASLPFGSELRTVELQFLQLTHRQIAVMLHPAHIFTQLLS